MAGEEVELFRRLVALPNLGRDDQAETLRDLLVDFSRHDVRVSGAAEAFSKVGHRDYLLRLAERGRHHLNRARVFVTKYPATTRPVVEPYGAEGNELRDFYHDAYYAGFYVARFGFVASGNYDCSEHAFIEKVTRKLLDRDPPVLDADKADRLERAALLVKDLHDKRNLADYVMTVSPTRWQNLGTPPIFSEYFQTLEGLYTEWGVP